MVRKYICNGCGREIETHAFIRVQVNYIVYDREQRKAKTKTLVSLAGKGVDYCPECAEKVASTIQEVVESVLSG